MTTASAVSLALSRGALVAASFVLSIFVGCNHEPPPDAAPSAGATVSAKQAPRGPVAVEVAPFDVFPNDASYGFRLRFSQALLHRGDERRNQSPAATIVPPVAGTFVWASDSEIEFVPKDPLPAGAQFDVDLAAVGAATHANLTNPLVRIQLPEPHLEVTRCVLRHTSTDPIVRRFEITVLLNNALDGYSVFASERERIVAAVRSSMSASRRFDDGQSEAIQLRVELEENSLRIETSGADMLRPGSDGAVSFALQPGLVAIGGKTFNGDSCTVAFRDAEWRTELDAAIADSNANKVPLKAFPMSFLEPSSKGREALTVRFVDPAHKDQAVDHKRAAGEILEKGVRLEPSAAGVWKVGEGSDLIFEPKQEWLPGQHYTVILEPSEFPELELTPVTTEFVAYSLTAQFADLDAGTVPDDKTRRVVSASIDFNYPVDTDPLEKIVSVTISEKGRKGSNQSNRFSIERAADDPLRVFVRTTPLELQEFPTIVDFRVRGGLQSALGGQAAKLDNGRLYELPSRQDIFVVRSVDVAVVKSATEELQRIVTLAVSEDVEEALLNGAVSVLLLPDCKDKNNRKLCSDNDSFFDANLVTPDVEKRSETIPLSFVSRSDDEAEPGFSYSFQAKGGRQILVQVTGGLTSKLGFPLSKTYRQVVHLKEYPKRLDIMLDGMLLSLSGSRRLGVLAQNIDKIKYRLSRVRATDLHHLVYVTSGAFSRPQLETRFTYDDMARPFEFTEELPESPSGKPSYTSVDFSRFIDTAGSLPRGLFFLEIKDAEASEPEQPECHQYWCQRWSEEEAAARDSRLILLTDLGLVVKRELAGGDRVYVVSFRAGMPVAGAEVRLVSRNGSTLFSAKSDENGQVSFPDVSSFKRDKEPVMYVAQKDDDLTFLPYRPRDRQLDFSRFDIGGVINTEEPDALRALLFTDRGIYRPGESVHFALTVRNRDFSPPATALPLVFRISDPRGQPVLRDVVQIPQSGITDAIYQSTEAGLTGTYAAELIIPARADLPDRVLSSIDFRVEEFEPDRLRIRSTLGTGGDAIAEPLAGLQGRATLTNLFGAPAAGNQIKASISVEPWAGFLTAFPKYNFRPRENQARSRALVELGEQTTDERGDAAFAIMIPDVAGTVLEAVFAVEGFEKDSGRSVAAMSRGLLTDLSLLVGVKSEDDLTYVARDAARKIDLRAIDLQGRAVASGTMKLSVERQEWKNVLVKQPNGVFKYESARKLLPLRSTEIEIPEAGTSVDLDTQTPGTFLVSLVGESGVLLNQIEYTVVGEANEAIRVNRNANLELIADKPSYEPEATVEISVKAPYPGFGVITVEREAVLATTWFRMDTTSSVQRIQLPKEIIGNAYITVLLARAWDSQDIYLPPLSYASIPITIDDSHYLAPPQIDVAKQMRPGEPLAIRYDVSEPGALLLYAVDEGILQFGRYKAPEPLKALVPKRALEVLTRTALDLVMPDYGIVQSVLSPGGDGDVDLAKFQNPFKRKSRPPLAYWSGIIPVEAGTGEVSFPVPDYFDGAVKVFAYFVGGSRVGFSADRVEIRGDFVIKMNLPTFTAPGDELDLSVEVTNMTEADQSANVWMELDGLELIGEGSQTLELKPSIGQLARFRVKTVDRLGEATVKCTAASDAASRSASEGVGVRPAAPLMRTVAFGVFDPEKPNDTPSKMVAPLRQMYPELRVAEAFLSQSPGLLVDSLNRFMADYPYGCAEQVTSKALTALMLLSYAEERSARGDLAKQLQQATLSLAARMNGDGSIAYWRRGDYGDPFVSAYAAHFLIDATAAGFAPPGWVLESINTYLDGKSRENVFEVRTLFPQAYALYLRARSGAVVTNELTSMVGRLSATTPGWQGSALSWLIGSTYALLQMPDEANKWIAPTTETDLARLPFPLNSGAFNGGLIQYLKVRHFGGELDKDATFALLNRLEGDAPDSLTVGALALGLTPSGAAPTGIEGLTITTDQGPLALHGTRIRRGFLPENATQATFAGPAEREFFYSVVESGFDRRPARQGSRTQGVALARDVVDKDGNAVGSMKLGETYRVILRVQSARPVDDFAVQDLLPTGFEPDLEALKGRTSVGGEANAWACDQVDVRDDRLILFGDLAADTAVVFSYPVKPTVRGEFVWPGLYGEAMYDTRVFAWEASSTMSVQ